MIVCSCQTVSDFDIELALLDILKSAGSPDPELRASSTGICRSACSAAVARRWRSM